MLGLRRIRQLEAEVATLRAALDFYAINDNWRRRARHVKGRQWELSAAAKDHGARAREALVKADAIRRKPLAKLADQVRAWWAHRRTERDQLREMEYLAMTRSQLPAVRVTVPAPLLDTPDSRPTGETA